MKHQRKLGIATAEKNAKVIIERRFNCLMPLFKWGSPDRIINSYPLSHIQNMSSSFKGKRFSYSDVNSLQ